MKDNDYYMMLALKQAKKCKKSRKYYSVGAIIVKNNKIIGTGYSLKFKDLHAEECATKFAKENPKDATLYTTMEPCSLRLSGKTPCSSIIIKKKISKVVFAAKEPKIFVNCKGIKILKKHKIKTLQLEKYEKMSLRLNNHLLK